MILKYVLVFFLAFLFDVVPVPLPPASTTMTALQIIYNLNPWMVILVGVVGSILGRFILMLYIPHFAKKIFKDDKNKDVEFLGKKLKGKGWKSQAAILAYTLLPLPSTPLFVAGAMGKINPFKILPMFTVGKFISDAVVVLTGRYAALNINQFMQSLHSWKTITGLAVGILMISALLFIDWRTLIQSRKFTFKFGVFR